MSESITAGARRSSTLTVWRRCMRVGPSGRLGTKMGLRDELFELLIQLPAVDVAAERKSLLLVTGYSRLRPYLDLDGSTVEFMADLLEELGRCGQPVLTGFVAALPAAPQAAVGWAQIAVGA